LLDRNPASRLGCKEDVNDIVNQELNKDEKPPAPPNNKTPKGVDKVEDAQIIEKKGSNPTGKKTKQDEPEEHDMVPLWKRCSGLNKEFDQIVESSVNKDDMTPKGLLATATRLHKAKRMTSEELGDIKEQLEIWE